MRSSVAPTPLLIDGTLDRSRPPTGGATPAAAPPADATPTKAHHPRERAYRISSLLSVGDWIAACLAIFVSLHFRGWQRSGADGSLLGLAQFDVNPALIPWSIGGGLLFVWMMMLLKTYEVAELYRVQRWTRNLLKAALLWAVVLWAYMGLFPSRDYSPRIGVAYCAVALVGTVLLWRLASYVFLMDPRVREAASSRVIVVGWNTKAEHVRKAMRRDVAQLSEIIGCVPLPGGRFMRKPPADLAVLGGFAALPSLIAECKANSVILAESSCSHQTIQNLAAFCQREMIVFRMMPEYFPALNSGLQIAALSGVPLLGITQLPLDRTINRMIKRGMDLVGGLIGLLLTAPIVAGFALAVYLESPGPVFYSQRRTSRSGRTFSIFKVRSMRLDAEAASGAVWSTHDDPRRLKIGAFMRKYNIDELPQFWNVLKGDMSLVGPRPERPELIEKFKDSIPNYNARHEVRTGLTGWAQIHGLRGDTDLGQRVQADLYYLENWTPLLDVYCVLATFFSFKNAH